MRTKRLRAALGRERAVGSGVIVDPDGYIVTNAHVVKGADRVRVVLTPPITGESQAEGLLKARGRILPARIVGVSKLIDLAVLKVEATGFPRFRLAVITGCRRVKSCWRLAARKACRIP